MRKRSYLGKLLELNLNLVGCVSENPFKETAPSMMKFRTLRQRIQRENKNTWVWLKAKWTQQLKDAILAIFCIYILSIIFLTIYYLNNCVPQPPSNDIVTSYWLIKHNFLIHMGYFLQSNELYIFTFMKLSTYFASCE
jgi:hypothetical protein